MGETTKPEELCRVTRELGLRWPVGVTVTVSSATAYGLLNNLQCLSVH